MNLLEIGQECGLELDYNVQTFEGATPTAKIRRLKNHINRAYNYIWLELNHQNEDAETEITVSTTGGVNYIALPDGLNSVDQVMDGTNPLRIVPWPEFALNNQDFYLTQFEDYPATVSIYQKRLYCYPTPDSNYQFTLRGKATYQDLSLDADTPLLRASIHKCIVLWALVHAMAYENNPALPTMQGLATAALETARKAERNHSELPPAILSEDQYLDRYYGYRY